jgi:Flp pilus assembly protein TadD
MTSKTKADIGAIVGRITFDTGQKDEGLALAKWAVDNDPTNLEALSNLGYMLLSTGNADAARAPFEQCVLLYPRFYWCYNFLATIYAEEEAWAKAAEAHFHAYEVGSAERKEEHLAAAIEAYIQAGKPEKAQQMQTLLEQK